MRKTRNHKCFIGVAVAMSLIAVFPVVLFSLSATGAQTRTSLRPQANLNPCPKQTGKVNITFWTWEGPRRSYNISSTSSTPATRTST